MQNVTYYDTLTALECGECHIPFAIPSSMQRDRAQDGRWFHCPNGHRIRYLKDENARLRQEQERLRQRLASTEEDVRAARADAELERRRAAAHKGHVTRLKKRVGKGKCPCCSEEFPNIAEHMANEHPGYGDDETA